MPGLPPRFFLELSTLIIPTDAIQETSEPSNRNPAE